jgi:acetolactate synthase-1/2/3 large subunit
MKKATKRSGPATKSTPSTPLEGAQALVKCLEKEGVEYIFGLSGGAAIPIFDALVTTGTKIKLVLTRHEQGATHMADGYARATGKPAVVLVTSGPGAGNTITGLMTAHMDSVPMIVLSGQQIRPMLGKDAFQEADIFNITLPVVKHSYLVKETNAIPRIVREAFHISTTGRPGPVLIDLPKDVTQGPFDGALDQAMDVPGYQLHGDFDKAAVKEMAAAINRAQRPVLLVGHGVLISGAADTVRKLAEKIQAPVTTTLLGKGAFPETHPLSLGMVGMHGTAYANKAVVECDLLLNIGSRFDDRIIGQPAAFCKDAVRLHIDIDPCEIGKMIKAHVACVGDAGQIVDRICSPRWAGGIRTPG